MVRPNEQPLYGWMVVVSPAVVDMAVGGGGGRAKYNVYGKYVWARKYVKKESKNNFFLAN